MIAPNERLLVGRWVFDGERMLADETAARIETLIASYLRRVAIDQSGWQFLFRDPQDGRLWELTYPDGHMQGGGPPKLECVSLEAVRTTYAF